MSLSKLIVANIFVGMIVEDAERKIVFNKARRKADELGLPLLNYGCGTWRYAIDRSDINADIVPRDVPNFVLVTADSEHLPFDDKSVVIYASHVFEHLYNPDFLMREFQRISDHIYIITPKPVFLSAWLVPGHRWIYIGKERFRNPLYPLTKIFEKPYEALFR